MYRKIPGIAIPAGEDSGRWAAALTGKRGVTPAGRLSFARDPEKDILIADAPSGRMWARSAAAQTARTAASPLCAIAAWLTPALALPRHDASAVGKTKGQATSPSSMTRKPASFRTAANAPGSDNAPGCGGGAPGGGGGISGPSAGITALRNSHFSGSPQAVTTTRPPGLATRTSSRMAAAMSAA
jgi:hypothetical protein